MTPKWATANRRGARSAASAAGMTGHSPVSAPFGGWLRPSTVALPDLTAGDIDHPLTATASPLLSDEQHEAKRPFRELLQPSHSDPQLTFS